MKTTSKGFIAESLCAVILRLKGYKIITRNFKTKIGEIDLIARKGKHLVIVEVKFRPSKNIVHGIISKNQQKRIINTTNYFISRYPKYSNFHIRFDAMLFWKFGFTQIQNAWDGQ